jgi:hypothetical protein
MRTAQRAANTLLLRTATAFPKPRTQVRFLPGASPHTAVGSKPGGPFKRVDKAPTRSPRKRATRAHRHRRSPQLRRSRRRRSSERRHKSPSPQRRSAGSRGGASSRRDLSSGSRTGGSRSWSLLQPAKPASRRSCTTRRSSRPPSNGSIRTNEPALAADRDLIADRQRLLAAQVPGRKHLLPAVQLIAVLGQRSRLLKRGRGDGSRAGTPRTTAP